jgi:hypothetical protein
MNAAGKPDAIQGQYWERGWAEHEQMQLRRLANLSFAEKLAWLEEAHRVVLHLSSGQSESCKDEPL